MTELEKEMKSGFSSVRGGDVVGEHSVFFLWMEKE